jgi:hypothetical protein
MNGQALADVMNWRRWSAVLAACACGLGLALFVFIIAMDTYGILPSARNAPRPLMDLNQRFMYPQVVRSGRFDAAIFGTSTVRLLDPQKLDKATGFLFANLAMNAATPWEQTQIATLFAREIPQPKAVIWGIDPTWCEPDATSSAKQLTPRPFPPWLYGQPGWRDWFRLGNFTALEIAVRMAGYRLGVNKPRLRADGFEVFTPPEATYDLARAQAHLYRGSGGIKPDLTPLASPEVLTGNEVRALMFPALDWLDRDLARFSASAKRVLILSPVHAAYLPRRGSKAALIEAECKVRLLELAARRNAAIVDFRGFNDIAMTDENFWDPLHYRLPIAMRIEKVVSDILIGASGGASDPAVKIVPASGSLPSPR